MNTISTYKPSYEIIIAPTKYVVDRSEKLELLIYFSGDGKVDNAKIGIYTDEKSKLIKEDKENQPNYGHINAILNAGKIFSPSAQWKDKSEASILAAETGYVIQANPIKLKPHHKYLFESEYSGDHYITTVLTYNVADEAWQTAEKTIKIHVNSHYEQFQLTYVVIGIIVALLALLVSGILNEQVKEWSSKIANYFCKLFSKGGS